MLGLPTMLGLPKQMLGLPKRLKYGIPNEPESADR
jgi:hypothetical protein